MSDGFAGYKVLRRNENVFLYESRLQELRAELRPEGLIECDLVEEIGAARWRQQRSMAADNVRDELLYRRIYEKAMSELAKLQRRGVPPKKPTPKSCTNNLIVMKRSKLTAYSPAGMPAKDQAA